MKERKYLVESQEFLRGREVWTGYSVPHVRQRVAAEAPWLLPVSVTEYVEPEKLIVRRAAA